MSTAPKHTRRLPILPWSASHLWKVRPLSLLVITPALLLFGMAEGLLVRAQLGATPWVVLSQGLSQQSGLDIGLVTFYTSVVIMLLWWPLRMRPGLGTLLNMTLIALGLSLSLRWLPTPDHLATQALFCLGGVLLIGVSSAFYLSCQMGPGPRDGLMVGIFQKTGWRIGLIRTLIESSVCLIGWLLGGVVGVGTLLFAFGVGWILQGTLTLLQRWERPA